jgi:hypothetical protein
VIVAWDKLRAKCSELGIHCEFYDIEYEVMDNRLGLVLALVNNKYRELIADGRRVRMFHRTGREFDCDDYAWIYKALASNYGFTVGFALGLSEDMENPRRRFYHAYNVLPWWASDRVELFLLEPQNIISGLPFLYHMKSNT